AVRVHGPLATHREMERPNWKKRPQPRVTVPNYSETFTLNAVHADVWTWIREEHGVMRSMFSEESDDQMIAELANRRKTGGWTGELWDEYFKSAQHHRLDTWEGRYQLGRFTTGVLRMMESAVRVYGDIPRRRVRDVTRELLT
ncbi:MAG: hypothetical protein ACO36A_01285, partial [Ilumatobacteraceae bacterium]